MRKVNIEAHNALEAQTEKEEVRNGEYIKNEKYEI